VEAEAEAEGYRVKRLGLTLAALLLASMAMTVASASDLPVEGGTVQMVAVDPMPTLDPTRPAIPTPAPVPTASNPTPVPVESAPAATATYQPDPSSSPPPLP
jgi:hypothetical protein